VKVALAQFIYESNTFNKQAAGLECFTANGTWLSDPVAIRRWAQTGDSQLAGSLVALDQAGCETVPVFVAQCGTPGGRLSAECYQSVRTTLRDALKQNLPADALLLHLHGAVCAVGEDDVEGALLAMIRDELGYTGPIIVSLDLHANVTPAMLQHADAITAYRTFPHMDFFATGERAAQLVLHPQDTVRTIATLAALIPPTATDHRHGHFAEILAQARELEEQPGIIDVSIFPVQPWMDIAGLATSVVVTSTNAAAGAAAASQLADHWFAQRASWQTGLLTWPEIVQHLVQSAELPWLLVDTADATTGGSDGTSAEAIKHLWPLRNEFFGEVLLWVVDPAAVAAAQSGATRFQLGADKFPIGANVTFTGECRFQPRGKAYTGQPFSSGAAAVLSAGQLRIVVTEQGCLCADPAFYECLGLNPAAALAVQVKSHMGWQAGYEVGPERGLRFDGPGCTTLNFARLPFTGPRRELFPLKDSPPNPVKLWQSI
jgi:microcystin degradation protein MlrC